MLKRRNVLWFLFSLLAVVALLVSACGSQTSNGSNGESTGGKQLVIAEPLHSIGYLPLYVAIRQGFFQGITVKVVTLTGGSAHTNAVLSGQAFGFIGGPEHNAFAEVKGANLRAIVNVVNRGNVYLVARSDLSPGTDIKSFIKGKTIVTSQYGGTPNSIIRYLLSKWGYDVQTDVTLKEVDSAAIPEILKQKQGDIAVVSEPMLTQGIQQGIWNEPFYNVPKESGPYAYSTVNVKLDSVKSDPKTTQAFVDGMIKGLAFLRDNKAESMKIAKLEFPTMSEQLLQATVDRSYADNIWEFSGQVTKQSVDTALAVVRSAGLLKDDKIGYDNIIDMDFVNKK
ncbi:MAG: transporter substrate-binding protein [Bacilli bacterium]|nr:transporter substrate-binding protein [Bacilli bacterium]